MRHACKPNTKDTFALRHLSVSIFILVHLWVLPQQQTTTRFYTTRKYVF
jgi:hypothetical protein